MKQEMIKVEVAVDMVENVIATLEVPCYMQQYMVSLLTPFQEANEGSEIHGVVKATGEIYTLPQKEFFGSREWNWANIREVCCKYDLFTNGDNEQYNRLYEMLVGYSSLHDLMLVVWICSNREDFIEVEAIFRREFLPR